MSVSKEKFIELIKRKAQHMRMNSVSLVNPKKVKLPAVPKLPRSLEEKLGTDEEI